MPVVVFLLADLAVLAGLSAFPCGALIGDFGDFGLIARAKKPLLGNRIVVLLDNELLRGKLRRDES